LGTLALSSGDLLGPYEILAPLGKGGMGEVYRARDVRLGREVALKVLPENAANDAETLARFEREARAVAALNHPNILSIHDTGEHRGIPYAVTELLEGEILSDRLRAGPLSPMRAAELACQVADGLAAAHARGVIHRDIKPENIFLTNDGRAKILDFGIARIGPRPGDITSRVVAARGSSAGFVMGTAGYMSPEQVRGKSIDFRTDIFSLGAVFYEMLTGRRAYDRPSIVETMGAVLKDDPAKYPESDKIPESIRGFVFRSLEKDPADRYQSATDLLMDLRAYQAEQRHDAAERVQFRAEPPWKHRRTRVLLRAVGGILLFLLGFFAGSCWERRGVPVRASGPRVAFPTGRPPVYAEATAESSAPATTGRAPARSFGSGIGAAQHASPHAS
jgi:serine/threonine protein kinase